MANIPTQSTLDKDQLSSSKRLLLAVKDARNKLEAAERAKREPIAIVGIGCRFPGGAVNPDAYWDLLANQTDAIVEVPSDRWDIDAYYDPDPDKPNKMSTRYGGFLQCVDQFDAAFFNISPREALSMDPQQRLLLEVAWEALEDAAWVPEQMAGSATGVFVGATINDYGTQLAQAGKLDTYFSSGNVLNAIPGRLAYTLGLQGPCMAVDTACSSSLVAIHLASQSLRNGECDQALAGGVNIILAPENTVALSKARMMSPDGRCKTFDASANGFVRGEGCGVLVLKRLSDAIADGDRIQALIRSSAVNQDGASSGFTVPNRAAQESLIETALKAAKLDPASISYVEAHGTGTSLGDPVEVKALTTVLGKTRSSEQPLLIGSVKTNIGHLESAAGVAGVIKVALALQHQQLPAHLHFQEPNPYIPWADLPVKVTAEPMAWHPGEQPRLAGISSFGASGTNAHVILEEAPTPEPEADISDDRPLHLLTVSGETPKALTAQVARYQAYLGETDINGSFPSVCHTANAGRTSFSHRLAVTATSAMDAADRLAKYLDTVDVKGDLDGTSNLQGVHITQLASVGAQKPVFLFTGQGSQYSGMGRSLYQTHPIFRQAINDCQAVLEGLIDIPLTDLLFDETHADILNQTAYTQAALFAVEYALAQLWLSWGIKPVAVMGHSVGEYVAACIAGVFSLNDGLTLIEARGRLMQALPPGGEMVAVLATRTTVKDILASYGEKMAIAAVNGPKSIVISGPGQLMAKITEQLQQANIKFKALTVSHAFHSALMEPMLAEFEQVAQKITYAPPRLKLISNVTGHLANEEVATAAYWCRHIRQSVMFADGMQTLHKLGYETFIEIGPKPILLGMGQRCIPTTDTQHWLPSLRPSVPDWQTLLDSVAHLYVQGYQVDWQGFDQGFPRQRLSLPSYAFQRQRYWVDRAERSLATPYPTTLLNRRPEFHHPLLGTRLRSALKVVQFEGMIVANSPHFLRDHQVVDTVILPATAYFEMALAAAQTVAPDQSASLKTVAIHQPLVLSPEGQMLVQCMLTPDEQGTYRFEIFSSLLSPSEDTAPDDAVWTLHTDGIVQTAPQPARRDAQPLPTVPASAIEGIALYQQFQRQGFNYGPAFQGVKQVWRTDNGVVGQIALPAHLVNELDQYRLHPALLDACFQILAATAVDADTQPLYLPVTVSELRLYQSAEPNLWCCTENFQLTSEGQTVQTDLVLLSESGSVVAEIIGLTLRQVDRQVLMRSLQPDLENWLYRIDWQPLETPEAGTVAPNDGWMVFVNPDDVISQNLVVQLEAAGARCVQVLPGSEYRAMGPQQVEVNPANSEDLQQFVTDYCGTHQNYRGIVYLWGATTSVADLGAMSDEQMVRSQSIICGGVLHLVQAILQADLAALPQLWLVSRGAHTLAGIAATQPQSGSLWGLGRVLMLEHPDLSCRCIDLDPDEGTLVGTPLFAEITAEDAETQLAYRQGQRYGTRIVRYRTPVLAHAHHLSVPSTPYQVRIKEYGILENLQLVPTERRSPGPDEVEIEVRAVGLNFRDVLNALGMLKSFTEAMGVTDTADVPFGGECTGVVTAVGAHVTHLQMGDAVIAAQAIGCLSSHAIVPAAFVVPKPASLSFEAAATIPTAFLTAFYGLKNQAQLTRGETILIHSAAGGVGQAAVQIALWLGANVWGTASTPKWPTLKAMGVKQVFNSRTLDFADQISSARQGSGIDVVLNSLNGDFIPKSLSVLKPNGRFVEIGKIGIWTAEQVTDLRPDVTYLPFDMLDISIETPQRIGDWLQDLMPLFEQDQLTPLPHKVFSIEQLVDAFRFMAQAKHIGKVVIALPPIDEGRTDSSAVNARTVIDSEGTYMVTGGFGALGQQVAHWLAQQGARQIVLTGRRIPEQADILIELAEQDVRVKPISADISQPAAVRDMIQQIEASLPPLKGIFHAAGVLNDAMVAGQTWQHFEQVMATKVTGTWQLHQYTRHMDLDCFVCFSSVSAVVGSPGQANYAAANAFMDSFAAYRQGLGLPALSVNWGPWSQSGMAAALQSRDQARWAAQGVNLIEPHQGMAMLNRLVTEAQDPQAIALVVDWSRYLSQMPPGSSPPILDILAEDYGVSGGETATFLPELEAATPSQRKPLLLNYVQSQLGRILGLSATDSLDPQQGLADLGMDSLMAVELRNRLQSGLGCPVPTTVVFDYPTIAALVDYLAVTLALDANDPGTDDSNLMAEIIAPETTAPEAEESIEDSLSDSEAEALLLQKLDSMRY